MAAGKQAAKKKPCERLNSKGLASTAPAQKTEALNASKIQKRMHEASFFGLNLALRHSYTERERANGGFLMKYWRMPAIMASASFTW